VQERVYEFDATEQKRMQELLLADPYAEISFAKQGYKVKEGKLIGADASKFYLYVKAEVDFFRWAEEKFRAAGINTAKRAPSEAEARIIQQIHEEEERAQQGFGAIFG